MEAPVTMKEFSIVISAYNEADKITSTLTQITNFMKSFTESYEVIIVNDGSKDATSSLVAAYAAENPNVVLIDNVHKGKGVGVLTGVQKAVGQYIYMCDADLSAPISELKKLSLWVRDHDVDIVIASREGAGSHRINEPFYRHIMGRVFNLIVQWLVLPGIKDSQCGFKLFKGSVAHEIFSKLKVYSADSKELKDAYLGAFDVELLYIARKLGYTIKEVPVTWTYVRTTRLSPFKDSVRMLRDVVKIKLNSLKGIYTKNII